MPDFGDKLINSSFLSAVTSCKLWLPNTHNMVFKECLNPPSSEKLREMAIEQLQARIDKPGASKLISEMRRKTIQEMEKRCPRKNFLIKLIYQLKPDHEIFELDYEPP